MPYELKKWLPLCCVLTFSAQGNDVTSSEGHQGFVDNNILTTMAEHNPLVEKSVFLEIESYKQQQILVGEYGRILFRKDANTHWQQANVPVQTTITAVDFVDSKTVWAVGHQGVILKSVDAGKNWIKVFDGTELSGLLRTSLETQIAELTPLLETETDSDRYDELEVLLDDASYKLEDITENSGVEIAFFDVKFVTPSTGFIIGAYGSMLQTQDGGKTWQYIGHQIPNPDGFHLNAFAENAQGQLFVVGEAGFAMRTSDNLQWQRLAIDYQGSLFGITANNSALFVYGLRGNMFYSNNAGNDWSAIDTGVTNHIFAADWLPSGELLLVGAAGLKLVYDGVQFTNISRNSERVDITSIKINGEDVITTGMEGWKSNIFSALTQGDRQ